MNNPTKTEYDIRMIPLIEIYSDEKFNCRGSIERADVLPLMESIKLTRLETPIVVQKIEECVVITPPPTGVLYRVVAGNRRFMAMRCLNKDHPEDEKYQKIACIIRSGLTDDQARALNLEENLKRTDLTILQEAQALAHWRRIGYTQDVVARLIDMSRSWVQIRFNLLDLPADLQEYAAKGLIGQNEIKELYSLRSNIDLLYARARTIIEAAILGKKPPRPRAKRVQRRAEKPGRARTKGEMEELMQHVADNVGYGLLTRLMAWCAGNVSTFDILKEIKQTGSALGNPYVPLVEEQLEHL